MPAVAFDTLKLARRLETAGFTHDQATGASEALAESIAGDLAIKADLAELRRSIETRFSAIDGKFASIDGRFATLGAELRTEIAAVRSGTAQWIIGAAFVNILSMLGAIAAVWQFAHK